MSEQANQTEHDNSKIDDAVRKFEEALHGHKNMTAEELNKLKMEMQKTLHEAQEADRHERAELKKAIEEIQGHIAEERKRREEHDKVKETEHTIVVPPDDVTPPPPQDPEPVYSEDEGKSRKGSWKRFW